MAEESVGFTRQDAGTDAARAHLGERLREARDYVGLTQDEVAKRLGIPRSALSNIEAGVRRVDALELRTLAKLYQRPVAWFTGRKARRRPRSCHVRSPTSPAPPRRCPAATARS